MRILLFNVELPRWTGSRLIQLSTITFQCAIDQMRLTDFSGDSLNLNQ
jgi:hypothetical protein